MKEFPRTLAAVEAAERSLWPVVWGLADEIAVTKTGSARNGEYDRCTKFLADNGYRAYSLSRLKMLHSLGAWVDDPESSRRRDDWEAYPVEKVIEARKAKKGDHDDAFTLLVETSGKGKRAIRPDKVTANQIIDSVKDLPDEAVERIEKAVADEAVKRTVYADQPKPKFKDAKRKASAKQARRLQENPDQAASAFIASLGRGYAQIRMIGKDYQEFLALVKDEGWREYARENLIAFQTEVNLALGEMLEGSLDTALARLLEEE